MLVLGDAQTPGLPAPPPERWADLLAEVSEFVDPLIADVGGELTTWDAHGTRWRGD
jgi:hypothetical protein